MAMVKSVLGVNHQGLRDWIIQRVSAIMMLVYFVFLIAFIAMHPDLSYVDWHSLFSSLWMKTFTLLVLLALLLHAWVGMWTIFTDYVKPFVLCFILNTIVLLSLAACFLAGILILWSV
jgi:succinate dehydrogenase / fumarate reductase membrane anchor subunit